MQFKTVAITSLVVGVAYALWVQLTVPVEAEDLEEVVFPAPSAPLE
jgi:hypothetical protein